MSVSVKFRRGASAVFTVLLILVASASVLAAWHVLDDAERRRNENVELGRLFGIWLQVAHAATMRNDYRVALTAEPDGFSVAPSSLPGVPAGLRAPAVITVGVMADGNDVPMAWAVLAVDREAREAARNGAFGAGLGDVAVAGSGASAMAGYEAAVGIARGASIPDGALFATADLAISYEEGLLYRREQPGRPWANRMEAALDLGGNDVQGAARFEAVTAVTAGNAVSRGGARIEGEAESAGLTTGEMEAGEVEAVSLTAAGSSVLGSVRVGSDVASQSVVATRRLEAASVVTTGVVEADLLVIGGSMEVMIVPGVSPAGGGSLTLAGDVVARDLQVIGTLDVGPASVTGLRLGALRSDGFTAESMTVRGVVFGPCSRITGTMRVTGTCDGCRPPGGNAC